MRYVITVVSALLLLAVVAMPVVAQESTAVKTVAGILLTVNHFPSDTEKATLEKLAAASTTTESEKVLIEAFVNLQHSVPAADKEKLEAIVADQDASASVKSLATILGRFLHMASDADKAMLEQLAM